LNPITIFIVSVGPNAFPNNLEQTIRSLVANIGVDDYCFYIVTGRADLEQAADRAVPRGKMLDHKRTLGWWADDFNTFFQKYADQTEWLVMCHDDIDIFTPNFFKKTMAEIHGASGEIGWVTFTNNQYYVVNSSISVRGGLYNDRLAFQSFECHRPDKVLDYPSRAVKTYGPYSHFNMIRTSAMKKVGPCPRWTEYTILVDEDWALQSVVNGLTNVWVPSIFYRHPNNAGNRGCDLRLEPQAHAAFIAKWGFDTPFSDQTVRELVRKYPHLSYLANKNSYEWTYLKEA
jgi:hypothetical protein